MGGGVVQPQGKYDTTLSCLEIRSGVIVQEAFQCLVTACIDVAWPVRSNAKKTKMVHTIHSIWHVAAVSFKVDAEVLSPW